MKRETCGSQEPFVAISMSTLELTTRNMLRGVLRYMRENKHLLCRFCLGRPGDELLEKCLTSRCVGVMTDRWSPAIARRIRAYGIPAVGINLSPVPRTLVGAARKLIEEGKLPQDAIAQACGFYDASHLYRTLRRGGEGAATPAGRGTGRRSRRASGCPECRT